MAVFTVLNIPDGIKRQYKKSCEKNNISMAKVTIDFMMNYIAENVIIIDELTNHEEE